MIICFLLIYCGWIGVVLLLSAYVFLIFDKTKQLFIPVNIIASLLLTFHAIYIKDIVFTIVDMMIVIMLTIKFVWKKSV